MDGETQEDHLRSRSRSRSLPLARLRSQLSFPLRTEAFNRAVFLRQWQRYLPSRPILVDDLLWLPLCKEREHWPGNIWARVERPYVLECRGLTYVLEVSIWIGSSQQTSVRQNLLRGSANGGQALIFNWPGAPRGEGRVIVSRLLGMSLLFNEDRWSAQEYSRFDDDLHVHHLDDNHPNCLLGNLSVEVGPQHIAYHNRWRRRLR